MKVTVAPHEQWTDALASFYLPVSPAHPTGHTFIGAYIVVVPSVAFSASFEHGAGRYGGGGDGSFLLWFFVGPLFLVFVLWSLCIPLMLLVSIFCKIFCSAESYTKMSTTLGFSVGQIFLMFSLSIFVWIILSWFLNHEFRLLWAILATIGTLIGIGVICGVLLLAIGGLYGKFFKRR
jgi:hypothetical protein